MYKSVNGEKTVRETGTEISRKIMGKVPEEKVSG